jgi:competence protein ComEA
MKVSREQGLIILLAVIILGISVVFYLQKANNGIVISSAIHAPVNPDSGDDIALKSEDEFDSPTTNSNSSNTKKIIIHVAGEVLKPGVYELTEGSRVIDAVRIASGGTQYADLDALNLAAPIYDGEKIYIPSIFETAQNQGEFNNNPGIVQNPTANHTQGGLINVNSATVEELMELPGIGPGKAKNIIDFRKKVGRFQKKEELLEVSGIGEKTLEKIQDLITIR